MTPVGFFIGWFLVSVVASLFIGRVIGVGMQEPEDARFVEVRRR